MAGVFGGQVEAVAGMLFQAAAHHRLGQILHIGPGGVEIIDAVGQRIVHHRLGGVLVDGAVHRGRQAHGAEAQQGQVQVLKITIDHGIALLFCGAILPRKMAERKSGIGRAVRLRRRCTRERACGMMETVLGDRLHQLKCGLEMTF